MHPLLHSLTAMKLYPGNEIIILAAYLPDLYPVKTLFHKEIYSREKATVDDIKRTINRIRSKATQDECIGFSVHLLGDVWWENHIRYLFKGLSLFYRRCVETSWGMVYLNEMFPEESEYIYNLVKSKKEKLIEIVRHLLNEEFNVNELIVEINETAEHLKSPRVRFRAGIPKIQEYHEIIYEKFDLDDLLKYIADGIKVII